MVASYQVELYSPTNSHRLYAHLCDQNFEIGQVILTLTFELKSLRPEIALNSIA